MRGVARTRCCPRRSGQPCALVVAVTVGLYVWRRNALVSILVGTVVHDAPATLLARGT